jgi:glycosyltransferase involved in cell wall biosynthesis
VRNRPRRPRILYFSPYWPEQVASAGELRAMHVARGLQEIGELEMVVVYDHERADRPDTEFKVVCSVPVRPRPSVSFGQKLRWALNPRTAYPHGQGVDDDATRRVLRIAEEFDMLWFCMLRTANMFPRWSWPRSVLDIDNVPSTYEQSVWKTERGLRNRLLAAKRIFGWRRRDKLLGERFTALGVCSETDKCYLQNLGVKAPLYVIPNGFERPAVPPIRQVATPPRIGFIGVFDQWHPNLGGIRWFASQCWPRIKHEVPDARLRLLGRDSDGPLKPEGPEIDGLGWLDNAADEIATWSASVVPICVGAGTRGKIAHAFSLKCPVVSTALGACGYDVTDGREVFLADSAKDFANACVRAIRQPAQAAIMAEKAWQLFQDRWTWHTIRPSIWAAAEHCLRLNAGG